MRHKRAKNKLGRPTDQRIALMKSLVAALFSYQRIQTTDTRARAARRIAERIITLGKDGSLHARRQALRWIPKKEIIKNVFENIVPRYKDRKGGYTRIVKVGFRRGDAASMSQLELVD